MSRNLTSLALRVMNDRRASTSSPISTLNSSSAWAASSSVTWSSSRVAGFIVVSHSSLAFISPRPLKRCTASRGRGSFRPAAIPASMIRSRSASE